MHPFVYRRPTTAEQAIAEASERESQNPPTGSPAQFIAGGTNMSDYMRLNVAKPDVVIDINRFPRQLYGRIDVSEQGLRVGSLVRMAEAEDHPVIRNEYPVLFQALQLAATRQIRNKASLGGNVLQRTRCEYFRETSWPCNKRNPGSGCAAMEGVNRQHAVLGVSDSCIAAYPGDFAQALIALDAMVETMGPNGRRRIRFAQLHRPPADAPNIETVLQPGELITFYYISSGPWTRRSLYLKIRDRASYQFALASAAVALDLDSDTVKDVRLALGGVATVPWRARDAEDALKGKVLDEAAAERAAELAFAHAKPRQHNAFKIQLGKQTVVRALLQAKSMQV
jgi:xanthine dehydrogenase YagS FAD-binding subunit